MMMRSLFALALVPLTLASCTSAQLKDEDARNAEDRAVQDMEAKTGHHLESLGIMGINDLHGALAPIELKSREPDGAPGVPYETGGAAILATHVELQRERNGSDFLLLDAGDEFQGTIESNLAQGAPVTQFYNAIGVNAAAIGNHEFDFGPAQGPSTVPGAATDLQGALKTRMSEASFPYLDANITAKETGEAPDFPKAVPSRLFSVGGLKVGVIGLSTQTTPVTTRAKFVANLEFGDLAQAAERESKKLRDEGANIVVVVAHAGLFCGSGSTRLGYMMRKPSDPQGDCGPKDEIVQFLDKLPPGTVDAVVSGHTHSVVHHWVDGVPVIQGASSGKYYNVIHLTYDWSDEKLVPELTRIEGPIPVCPKVFKNQNDCNGELPPPHVGRGPLVTPHLYGHEIKPDPAIEAILQPVFARSAKAKAEVVGQAARALEHIRTAESPLGDVVADSLRSASGADVALMNAGGIRANVEAGPITYEEAFRVLPFDNSVSVLKVTGKELKNILRVAESGMRGFFPVSGLKLRLVDLKYDAPAIDVSKDGTKELWEINRLISATLSDGTPIDDHKFYKLATIDFLVTGGDDMGWPMSQVPASRIQMDSGILMRDAFVDYLRKAGPINTPERPVVDPANPRMIFERPQALRKSRRAKRHRRSAHKRKHRK